MLQEKLRFAETTDCVEALKNLSQDEDFIIRSYVASNINTPSWILDQMSENDKEENLESIRYYVSSNSNTSAETLAKLSADSYWTMRSHVAVHFKTPVQVLDILGEDSDLNVRIMVAGNTNASAETLQRLSCDERAMGYAIRNKSNYRIKEMIKVGMKSELDILCRRLNINYVWFRSWEQDFFKIRL